MFAERCPEALSITNADQITPLFLACIHEDVPDETIKTLIKLYLESVQVAESFGLSHFMLFAFLAQQGANSFYCYFTSFQRLLASRRQVLTARHSPFIFFFNVIVIVKFQLKMWKNFSSCTQMRPSR
jgi:hypothetical protein